MKSAMREGEAETRPPEAAGLPSPLHQSSPNGRPGTHHILPFSPSTLAAAPSGGKEGSTGSGGDRGDLPCGEIGREEARWVQWRAFFSDGTDPVIWIEGRLHFTPCSQWMVLLDLENDVLAGDFSPGRRHD